MTRQIYTWTSSAPSASALMTALAGNHVGAVHVDNTASSVYVDFLADELSTEQSSAQTICTGSPYSLTFGSQVSTTSAAQWDPRDFGASLACWLDSGHLTHMFKEYNGLAQVNNVASAGDSVGCVQESSWGATHWFAAGSANTPTWNTSGAPECHFVFSSSGSGTYLSASNSTNQFAFIHNTGVFGIAFAMQVASNGTQLEFLDSGGGSGTNYGIYVRRNTTNTLFVRLSANFGSSTFIWSGNTTQTLQTTDGMVLVTLSANGTGNLTVQIGAKTADTIAQTHTPPASSHATATTSPLTVGRTYAATGTPFAGNIRFMVILNRALTSTDITQLTNYMGLMRQSSIMLYRLYGTGLIAPCLYYFDFSTPSYAGGGGMWTNTSRTTAVANNGDAVAVIDHALDPTNAWGRSFVQSTSTNQAAYRPSITVPGIEFNGTATPNNTNYNFLGPIPGGMWTLVMISLNRDNTYGSHIMITAGQVPFTGNLYASNGAPNQPYTTAHLGNALTIGNTQLLPALNPQAFVMEMTRAPLNVFRQRISGNNSNEFTSTCSGGSTTTQGTWVPVNMGNQVITNWEMDGYQSIFMLFPLTLTRAQVDSMIMPVLKSKFTGAVFYS